MTEEFVTALPLQDLAPGTMRAVQVRGREVLLCHTKEGVTAFDNVCSHALARMSEGRLRGTRLICPLHGASFDARNGHVLAPPATAPLCRHAVRISAGFIEVALAQAPGLRSSG
jgi:nitrite reductase/ring-hydroxylating ferredoxin subunit